MRLSIKTGRKRKYGREEIEKQKGDENRKGRERRKRGACRIDQATGNDSRTRGPIVYILVVMTSRILRRTWIHVHYIQAQYVATCIGVCVCNIGFILFRRVSLHTSAVIEKERRIGENGNRCLDE